MVASIYALARLQRMHHVEIVSRLEGQHVEDLGPLIATATQADGHEPLGEHKFLRLKRGDDLAVAVLAYEGGRLAGYAHTLTFGEGEERRVSCELVVHPDERKQGIGSGMLQRVVAHTREQGARRLDVWAYNDSEASRRFAAGAGLEVSRRLLHMHRHPGEPPFIADPPGVRVRPFRDGEDETWLALNNHIFREHPENGAWTIEDFRARAAQPWFRADDLLMLEVDGRLGGFCWLKVEERRDEGWVGEVYIIGTAPEYQGRGLGRYLLSRALSHLHQRGVDGVAVYVDQSNERGVALYWALDFHHHHVDVCYSMGLAPAAEGEGESLAVIG